MKRSQSSSREQKYGKQVFIGAIVGIGLMTFVVFGLPHFLPPAQVLAHGETVVAHYHVKIEGVNLPAGIGIDAPLHTHDADGYIHIETKANRDYTLGDFLKIWGVQYKGVKLETVTEANAFGQPHYYNIPEPLTYVFNEGDHLRLTLDQ